jgi:DNA modification methylase
MKPSGEGTHVATLSEEYRGNGTISVSDIRSPKRRPRSQPSRADWFRYYADFSAEFVEDIISHLDLSPGATLLDPWLGAGTTAEVATARGFRFKGYDINPVMLLVSRARTIPTTAATQIPIFIESIARSYKKNTKNGMKLSDSRIDPLEQWLQPASAHAFRILERSVETSLFERQESLATPLWRRADQASPLLALFYVGLFRTLRYFISDFQSSNPTWIKVSNGGERIQVSSERLLNRFRKEVESLLTSIRAETQVMPSVSNRRCGINRASSLRLPVASGSIDVAVSSPPYCTRIDYVRATLPELAVIGYPNGTVTRRLREQMIGTPTIDKCVTYDSHLWGNTCSRFLSAVQRHSSKASSTYYLKYYRQYFASVFASLVEIDRVLKPRGQCVLVVQDSYYKDIKNNLPRIFIEMGAQFRWTLNKKKPFRVNQTLAGVNPDVKAYRNTFHATEWALVFSK